MQFIVYEYKRAIQNENYREPYQTRFSIVF